MTSQYRNGLTWYRIGYCLLRGPYTFSWFFTITAKRYEPAHDTPCNETCVTRKDSDQPVNPPRDKGSRFWIARRLDITKTCLFKYTEKLITEKLKISRQKKSNNFHISAQNIDCGYSLEPPRRGGSNEYPQSVFLSSNKKNNVYPCKPQFYYIKVGFKGVKII